MNKIQMHRRIVVYFNIIASTYTIKKRNDGRKAGERENNTRTHKCTSQLHQKGGQNNDSWSCSPQVSSSDSFPTSKLV